MKLGHPKVPMERYRPASGNSDHDVAPNGRSAASRRLSQNAGDEPIQLDSTLGLLGLRWARTRQVQMPRLTSAAVT